MNRAEGLVQRRAVATASATGSAASGARTNDVEENGDSGAGGYENDADSKETRLTLMEEVLLLGLKDKEVRGD